MPMGNRYRPKCAGLVRSSLPWFLQGGRSGLRPVGLSSVRMPRLTYHQVLSIDEKSQIQALERNRSPRPFIWTKPASAIFDALSRAP